MPVPKGTAQELVEIFPQKKSLVNCSKNGSKAGVGTVL